MTGQSDGCQGGRKGHGLFHKPRHNMSMATKQKKTMEDYYFYIGSSKQASDYKTTAKFLINYIQQTLEDGHNVAVLLQTLQEIDTTKWAPMLQVSDA